MSRYSDDSDSDSSPRRSKKKRHRRSRSRSREKKSRHRSRSRSRSRDRRRRSRSRSRDRKHRHRNRRRSRSRDRRSRSSSSSSRSREDVRSSRLSSRDRSEVIVVEERQPVSVSTINTISDQLKRARAIAEIDSESFSQKGFKSSAVRSEKKGGEEVETGFEFGTSVERKKISEAEEKLEKINKEGIFHPALFGDQAAREKRYLQHIWTIRQRALQKTRT